MIAPVKKFGRVGLRTNFYSKQTWRWRGRRRSRVSLYLAYARLCWSSIISVIPSLNIQGKASIAFFVPFCYLIWLPFLLFWVLILQRGLNHFLTHFTAARFSFTKNCRSRLCRCFIYIHCRCFFLYRNYPGGVNN